MSPLSPFTSQLILWVPMALIAVVTWLATRPRPEHDDMADLWNTYRHHFTDDEGESA